MGVRVFGLKEETDYGIMADNSNPDWHQNVTKANFKLGDEPKTSTGGSRMNKRARAGVMKPSGTTEGQVDLQRIGHYMKGFLDQYKFTAGTNGAMNIHEFYGGENTKLTSFNGWMTFDIFMKKLTGLLLDSLKLEVSDEYMTFSGDWIYKTEKIEKINPEIFEQLMLENDIPLMFYDINLKLDGKDPKGIYTSFSFEGKNNHNQDKAIGFGSRYPQRQAAAQQRDISLSIVTTLEEQTLETILAGEYGEVGAVEPSKCKIYKIPLELNVNICEDANRKMKILFPECILSVEYDLSESDEIEVTINLGTMGTGKATLADGTSKVTDMYVRIENDQPQIGTAVNVGSETQQSESVIGG